MKTSFCIATAILLAATSAVSADAVFNNQSNNGFFTPFNAGNASTVRYGDSGWLSAAGTPPYIIDAVTLRLASFGGTAQGTTDLVFTFNDGDPSGLVFGPGTTLYQTTVTGVTLEPTDGSSAFYFDLVINLPGIWTAGNFNNIGWSIRPVNYAFDGSFGFQCATASGQTLGYYTNNAAFYDGTAWSLFAFSQDSETGVANLVTLIEGRTTPACRADIGVQGGGYGQDGALDNNDFVSFIDLFFAQNTAGDLGQQGGLYGHDGLFDNNDFVSFIDLFFAGC